MDVSKANVADTDELVELRIAYLTEDNGRLGKDVERAIRRDLPDYYEVHLGKDLHVYAIREGSSIVSCAFLLVVQKPMSPAFPNGRTGIVLNVYTRPAGRHRGYATRVMQTLLADAEAMGLCVVELQATEDGYPLYQRVGFVDEKTKYHRMKWLNL